MNGAAADKDITFFAETNFRGQRRRFGIQRNDRRKHVYIIGKTGMGKTTLLENMTIQDIQAGHGVAVVDPHGEYAERILQFVPEHRIRDVVYFNPVDTDYPVAFNVMESVNEDQRHLITSGLLSVFKKIFGPEVWSARMEYLLANAILALLEVKGSTLLSVNRMFGEKEFRRQIVAQLTDPVIRGFWENEFAKYPEQYMREAVAAIQNKIGQFSGNPLIRNVIGQVETSLDMRAIMDEQKIFVVNLSKGKIGEENSRLLGAMMVTKLYLTAMSRVDIMPESARKDFYLYVDEFQNFATESFTNILSEARKYRLNLTVAHQYIAQMEEMVQHAIFGNVGTMVTFRVGAEDAELLEKEFMPEFMIQDLVNLGFKQVYLKLMIDGLTSRPFSAETLPPMPQPAQSFVEDIITHSRERYSAPRARVEEAIRAFTLGGREAFSGLGTRAASDAAKPDRPMYEAKCAVDGKPILVPFKPDGKRPVFCEEHMHLIQFRSQMGDVKPNEPAAGTAASSVPAGKGNDRVRTKERSPRPDAAKPLSLRELARNGTEDEPPRRPEERAGPSGEARPEHHLRELRKALADAMNKERPRERKPAPRPERESNGVPPNAASAPEPPPAAGPPAGGRKKEPAASRGSVMMPGEVIRLD